MFIFLTDLFFIFNDVDIASYADHNTPYVIEDHINCVIASLEKGQKALFEWFENILLKRNANKCHLLVSSSDAVSIRVSEYDIKIYALARIAPYMDLPKRHMVMNAFFNSQFNYCPLIRMFHNRTTKRKINRLHERCLCIYNDNIY